MYAAGPATNGAGQYRRFVSNVDLTRTDTRMPRTGILPI